MDDKLKIVKEKLEKYNQQHLIQFYSELTDVQKSNLLNQILKIDFEEILELYEKSKTDIFESTEEIEPIDYSIKSELSSNKIKQLTLLKSKITHMNPYIKTARK